MISFSPLERVDKWYLRVMTGGQTEGFPLGVATMAWRVGKVVGALLRRIFLESHRGSTAEKKKIQGCFVQLLQ